MLATAKRFCQGRDPIELVLTGGSTTTAVSTVWAYTSASANSYDGVWIYVADTTDDAAPIGSLVRVNAAGFAGASGTWTFSPTITTLASGDTCYFLYGPNRQAYLDAFNEVITNTYAPAWLPFPNLVTDGHMETSGTSNWTDVLTPTKAKVTTNTLVFCGTSSLSIVTNAVDEGVVSDSIDVLPSENLLISAAIKVTAGDCAVQLYDVTNSVILDQVENIDFSGWTIAFFEYQVGGSTEQVAVRILSDDTAVSTIYAGYVQVLSRERTVYTLPSSVDNIRHIDDVFYWPLAREAELSRAYIPQMAQRRSWPYNKDGLRDYQGANSQKMELRSYPRYPLFTQFRREDAAATLDTSVTTLPLQTVVEGMLASMYEKEAMKYRENSGMSRQYIKMASEARRTFQNMLAREGISDNMPRMNAPAALRVRI